jgi:hypothetical protein
VKHRSQKTVDGRVIAGCRPEHGQPHAAATGVRQVGRGTRDAILAHRKGILSSQLKPNAIKPLSDGFVK